MSDDTRDRIDAVSTRASLEAMLFPGEIACAFGQGSLGGFAVANNANRVCAILLGDRHEDLLAAIREAFPRAVLLQGASFSGRHVILNAVAGLLERPWVSPDLPLELGQSEFESLTRSALGSVEPGKTVTPEEVAERIGAGGAADAVRELAVRDLLAVAVPFHRLQEADGTSPSYRWGEARRRALLERETCR